MYSRSTAIPVVRTFYADDSSCEIAGRKHTIVGAIELSDVADALGRMVRCKWDLGLSTLDEIKWNQKNFTPEKREFISTALLPVLNRTTGFLVISEGHDKQATAVSLTRQLSDYCRSIETHAFMTVFDANIIQDRKAFDSETQSLSPSCMGWSEVDSSHNPLIQLADLFCGFQKLRLEFGTGRANSNKIVSFVDYDGGEPQQCELSFYLFGSLRYSLWGKTHDYGWDPDGDLSPLPSLPSKHTLGYGVRVFSSVPRGELLQAVSYLSREFMGCIH